MTYSHNSVYQSLLHHARQFVPSGVSVIEGESYGVRQMTPTTARPSVTVTLKDTASADVELGSYALSFGVVYTVAGASRLQRDALKDVVYSGILHAPLTIYRDFTVNNTPVTAAQCSAQLGDYIKITDIPMFETNREALFWTAVVFVECVLL